jgi:hypothetical protein
MEILRRRAALVLRWCCQSASGDTMILPWAGPPAQEHGRDLAQLSGSSQPAAGLELAYPFDGIVTCQRRQIDIADRVQQLATQRRHDLATLDHLAALQVALVGIQGGSRRTRSRFALTFFSPAGSPLLASRPRTIPIAAAISVGLTVASQTLNRRCARPRRPGTASTPFLPCRRCVGRSGGAPRSEARPGSCQAPPISPRPGAHLCRKMAATPKVRPPADPAFWVNLVRAH